MPERDGSAPPRVRLSAVRSILFWPSGLPVEDIRDVDYDPGLLMSVQIFTCTLCSSKNGSALDLVEMGRSVYHLHRFDLPPFRLVFS